MPTVKAVLRPPKNKDGEKRIFIRISDASGDRYVSTGLRVRPKYWNPNAREVRENDYYDATRYNKFIRDRKKEIEDDLYQLKVDKQAISASVLKKRAKSIEYRGDFIAYADMQAKRKGQGNVGTGNKYRSVIAKMKEFTGGKLKFSELSVTWLKDFSDWLHTEKENSPNTIHSNLRVIRAILYEAIREDQFPQEKNPFFRFRLKLPKVSRSKLNSDEIKKLVKVEPNGNRVQALAKDMFLFSFFAYGMRFRDVVLLRWKYIEGDYIRYEMGKTGESHSVPIYPPTRAIIDKYRPNKLDPEGFVFPLLNIRKNLDDRVILNREISSKNAYLNKELGNLARAAKLTKHVSFHTARHSYADIARTKGTDLHAISNSLGHGSLKTTEAYLQSLDNSTTDRALQSIYEEF